MSGNEGRRMSLKEISRAHFTTSLSNQSTPASSPKVKRTGNAGSTAFGRSLGTQQRRASTSSAVDRRLSMSASSSSARRRVSVAGGMVTPRAAATPTTPQVAAYSSRMVDKLQIRCEELEGEVDTIRKESAKREEDLRTILREAKVDIKALGVKLKQKDLEATELRKELERAQSKLLETEMTDEIHDENLKQLRLELQKSTNKVEALEKALSDKGTADRAAIFEEKKEKERILIESREQELEHLKAVDLVKQEVNESMVREMEAKSVADARLRELREKDDVIQRLELELAEEREHSSALEQDLELAESNLLAINETLKAVSRQQTCGKDLIKQSKELSEAKVAMELAKKNYMESDAALAKERFFHAEDLSGMVVERACHREMAQHNQQRILGVLRAMRTGITVAQGKLEEYVQAKAA
ncbi:hypothetical protein HOP50_01g09680 [Chloropicon primus]|uniref:Uncharacterized protein n=1 Tax=Chloropicon primus TaxID=1764295 RepID=A0A5B8ME74_9CHLO|nr:hypothetical protein A3770_01p09820 [Chloropicon primus]UPQ97673.1 hypothetical protein HOP50_01g09680 [Chloropicon primus]|eukprot:QDZ18464.1 hypothetical protein A3770_01p09820 [Chloropicon primus]